MTTFFVGGAMRTGTTVLQAILCSSIETNPLIDEAQYLTRLAHLYRFGKETFDRYQGPYFADRAELRDFHARMMGNVLNRTLARFAPANHLVLKNPEMTPLFPDLAELAGNAKFIAAVRDPRDTVASILDVANRQTAQGQASNLTLMGGDVGKIAAHVLSYYSPVLASSDREFKQKVILVRYEDLVREPVAAADRLADFTGLPIRGFNPVGAWRSAVDFTDGERTNEPFHATLRGKPLTTERIGRYKKTLSKTDIAAVEKITAGLMTTFRYAPTA
jgi:hypothetical protein